MSKGKPSSKNKPQQVKPAEAAEEASVPASAGLEAVPHKDRTVLYQKIALFVIAFLVFANSIPNKYNLDDELYTVNAQKIVERGVKALPHIFAHHTFSDNENAFEYRPMPMLSFALQFMSIGSSPAASHAVNVCLYALTIVLLFALLLKWFKKANPWFAFAVCLMFAVHPLHTEVVDSVKSRDELLAFLFAVMSFLVAWRSYETKKIFYVFLYGVIFMFGVLSKKTILPLMVVPSVAFYFFSDMPIKKILLWFIPVLLISRVTLYSVAMMLPQEQRLFFSMENPFFISDYSFATKAATAMYISGWYFYLHLVPIQLAFYYGYKYVPILGWDNIWVWVSSLFYLSLIIYILINLRKKSIPVFGAILFLLNIFIFSNLFRPAPGMMAERFMYAASLGFSISFCWVIFKLFRVEPAAFKFNVAGKRLAATLVVICCCYAARSVDRNMDWRSKVTLYTHDIKYLGESTKANTLNGELMMSVSNLYRRKAMSAKSAGDIDKAKIFYDSSVYYLKVARDNFEQSILISPNMGSAINNLAVIYFNLDSPLQARKYINMALNGTATMAGGDIALNANDRSKLNHNLGVLYFKNGQIDSALYQFEKAIYYDSTFGEAYIDMSEVLLMSHDTNKAMRVLLKAAKNMPQESIAYTDLANISLYQKDTASAVMYCERAAQMKKVNPQIVVFLKNYYTSKNNMERAQYYNNKLQKMMNDRQKNASRIPTD